MTDSTITSFEICLLSNNFLNLITSSDFFFRKTSTVDPTTTAQPITINPTITTQIPTTTTIKTTTPEPVTTTQIPTTQNPMPSDKCPTKGFAEIAYPYDCTKYYMCTDGNKELKNCPEGLHFDGATGSCDYIDIANCRQPSTVSPSTTSQATTTKPTVTTQKPTTKMPIPDHCPATGSIQIAYPEDCSKYFQCNDGKKTLMDCPENMNFNREIGSCDYWDSFDCEPATTWSPTGWTPDPMCPYPAERVTFYPDPSNCSLYFECVDGNKEVKECPDGLYWSQRMLACDFPQYVDCSITTLTDAKPTMTSQIFSTKIPSRDGDCPASGSIQIAYPDDCNKYYQCEIGHKELKNCPESLHFNGETRSCDYRDIVNCSQTRHGIPRNTQIEGPIVFLESEVAQLVHSEEKT
ncbi:hypothetical protein JTB14_023901 [Gonioctena quinquepunctata]|nr:hypothetical protein JTB14_023901 [Gonioctena quinquepunctata]